MYIGVQGKTNVWNGQPSSKPSSSKILSLQTTGRGLEESSVEYPTERTISYDQDMIQRIFSRTSSDLMIQLRHSGPLPMQTSKPPVSQLPIVTCKDASSPMSMGKQFKYSKPPPIDVNSYQQSKTVQSPTTKLKPVQQTEPEENGANNRNSSHRRKKSVIVLQEFERSTELMKQITLDQEPADFFDMTMFQQKIWQRLMGLSQAEINAACLLEIIINAPHEEYEVTIDIQNIPYNWDVSQLATLINQVHEKQKGHTVIQKPRLSMLIGRIKTQRLESSMKVFELINLVVNGVKVLVLEEQGK